MGTPKQHDLEHDFCTEGSTNEQDLEQDFCMEEITKEHDLEHDFSSKQHDTVLQNHENHAIFDSIQLVPQTTDQATQNV